jgi:hypothetical protein
VLLAMPPLPMPLPPAKKKKFTVQVEGEKKRQQTTLVQFTIGNSQEET